MDIENRYNLLVMKQQLASANKNKYQEKIKKLSSKIQDYEDARIILNKAIEIIHKNFKNDIEEIITNAIQNIFRRNFIFKLKFEEKRNSIESKIIIEENGEELDPEDEMGGSIVNIISIIFRIILWHISIEKKRNVFILDEPFEQTGKFIELLGMILKNLSDKYKFQIICITHNDKLIRYADRIFHVTHDGIKSNIIKRRK